MQQHSKEKHEWVVAKGKRWRAAKAQTLFHGPLRRYSEVTEEPNPTPENRHDEHPATQALLDEGERLNLEEAKHAAKIATDQHAVNNTL